MTISAVTRDLLKQMAGNTGRINDTIKVAVTYYSKRREMPDCNEYEYVEIVVKTTQTIASVLLDWCGHT